MSKLIEALQIFLKYSNSTKPTGCDYKTLYVGIDPDSVSSDDIIRLKTLGFLPCGNVFCSRQYGSF